MPIAGQRVLRWVDVTVLLLLAGSASLLTVRWPYTEKRVIEGLEQATHCSVRARHFQQTFFPEPGCVLDGLWAVRRSGDGTAEATRVTIRGSWWELLTLQHRVAEIRASGLRVRVLRGHAHNSSESQEAHHNAVSELVADGAVLEIEPSRPDQGPARFLFHNLLLTNLGEDAAIGVSTVLDPPQPSGRLKFSGTIGPFRRDEIGWTPVKGFFELTGSDLAQYNDLAGILDGKGRVGGTIAAITVGGSTSVADFEVNHTGHPTPLRAAYRATVSGLNGDVTLHSVEADLFHTHISASGTIASVPGEHGKTASIEFLGKQARIDDLLRLLTHGPTPALAGPIEFRAHTELPPGPGRFLKRVRLQGTFAIAKGRWTKAGTRSKVDELSARARGDKEEVKEETEPDVSCDLRGAVRLRDGTASLSQLLFRVPGATATGGGAYNLITKRIDINGIVVLEADVSEATSGFKSILLKPFNAAFRHRKHHRGAQLSASIKGVYPRPHYQVGPGK